MTLTYVKPTPITLKGHPQFNEIWLQDRIAEDPSILGLGDLELRDRERIQPKAGRLDLLLRHPESGKRYETEIMLGSLDANHIIRTLEYWDIERKRYPQFDHCAVIVAEDVTSRFLNVISLFNSSVPIIAIQLDAFQVGENIVLTFAKVLDEIILGDEDEDEPVGPTTDRTYWENKSSKASLKLVDNCLDILRELNPNVELKYNKYYIGLAESGAANNFAFFRPRKSTVAALVRVNDREGWVAKGEETNFDVVLSGKAHPNRITVKLPKDNSDDDMIYLKSLLAASHKESGQGEG